MKADKKLFLVVLTLIALLIPLAGSAKTVSLPNDIAWVMTSDTYPACVQQAYLNAINRLRILAGGKQPGTWCVVLDADETIISNVRFQAELAASGQGYSGAAWNAWCQRMEATALPGAIEFLNEVRNLGGKIIIVTNRQAPLGEPTIKNLKKVGIPFDVCLLREGVYQDDRSKARRRGDIEKGSVKNLPLGSRLPPLEILMLSGDQTHDLYEGKSLDEVKDRFGKDLIVIPNPMYGDWTKTTFESPSGAAPAREPVALPANQPAPDSADQTATAAAPSKVTGAAITWQEAMQRVGQTVTIEAKIVSIYDPAIRGKTGPVKLNTDRDWNTSLTIVFFNKDGKFGDPSRFDGEIVRATGKVSIYRDTTQLMVYRPEDIEIVN